MASFQAIDDESFAAAAIEELIQSTAGEIKDMGIENEDYDSNQDLMAYADGCIDRVLRIIHSAESSDQREEVIKRLIKPILLYVESKQRGSHEIYNDQMFSMIRKIWDSAFEMSKVETEFSNSVTLVCLLFNSAPRQSSELFKFEENNFSIWSLILSGMLSKYGIVRKRSAYLIQCMSSIDPTRAGKGNQDKPWCSKYLLIYNQIEGSNSLHLIQQILPLLDSLCEVAVGKSEDRIKQSFVPDFSFPWIKSILHCLLQCQVPGIRRSALHKILSGSIPLMISYDTISWLCFELLGDFADSVVYFSTYFINRDLDIGCYLAIEGIQSGECISRNRDGGYVLQFPIHIQKSIDTLVMGHKSPVNPTSHPGALLPSFLAALLASCQLVDANQAVEDSSEEKKRPLPLSHYLIRSLLHALCKPSGIASLSAVKWICRAFSENAVQRLLPACLELSALSEIKLFLSNRVLSSNGVVKLQIYQGIIPLLLRCSNFSADRSRVTTVTQIDAIQRIHLSTNLGNIANEFDRNTISSTVYTDSSVEVIRELCILLKIMIDMIGLDVMFEGSSNYLWLLRQAIIPIQLVTINDQIVELSDEDYYYIAVASCCLPSIDRNSDISSKWNICNENIKLFDAISKLYGSPYLPASVIAASISFSAGLFSCISQSIDVILCNEPIEYQLNEKREDGKIFRLDSLLVHSRVDLFVLSAADLSSFLHTNILESIAQSSCNNSGSTFSLPSTTSFIKTEKLLEQATDALSACMLVCCLTLYLHAHGAVYGAQSVITNNSEPAVDAGCELLAISQNKMLLQSIYESVTTNVTKLVRQLQNLYACAAGDKGDKIYITKAFIHNTISKLFSTISRCKLVIHRTKLFLQSNNCVISADVTAFDSLYESDFLNWCEEICLTALKRFNKIQLANEMFRTLKENIFSNNTRGESELIVSYIIECDQVSKHNAKLLKHRWNLIHNALCCLLCQKGLTDTESFVSAVLSTNLCLNILRQAIDECEICPIESVAGIIACIGATSKVLLVSASAGQAIDGLLLK